MGLYYIAYDLEKNPSLSHHGIKGQKWGVRRWQYRDGSLTPEGYPHYGYNGPRKTGHSEGRKRNIFEKTHLSRKIRNSSSWEKSQKHVINELEKLPQEKIKSLLTARKELLKSTEAWNAMLDSKAFKDLSKETYQDTVDWFKKNDPEHLEKIVRKYGLKDLDYDRSFSKKFEATRNSRLSETSVYKDSETANAVYKKERDAVVKELIGNNGNKSVSSNVDKSQTTTVNDMINRTIDIWAYNKINA